MTLFWIAAIAIVIISYLMRNRWALNTYFIKKLYGLHLFISALSFIILSSLIVGMFYHHFHTISGPNARNGIGMAVIVFVPGLLFTLLTVLLPAIGLIWYDRLQRFHPTLIVLTTVILVPVATWAGFALYAFLSHYDQISLHTHQTSLMHSTILKSCI